MFTVFIFIVIPLIIQILNIIGDANIGRTVINKRNPIHNFSLISYNHCYKSPPYTL